MSARHSPQQECPAAEQGDEADEAKRIGASQLIPGVRRTIGGAMTTRRIVWLLLFAVPLAPAAPAPACVCYESHGLKADFADAAAVFAGQVVALQIAPDAAGGEQTIATFRVERRWKGPKDAEIRVRTCGTQEMICTCGNDFPLGAHFVVFALGTPLSTSSCQRTRRYNRVPGDLGLQWVGAEDLVRDLDQLAGTER